MKKEDFVFLFFFASILEVSTGVWYAATWMYLKSIQFSSVQLFSCIQLFTIPWTVACQASMSITDAQSLLKLISIKSMMPSIHLILCHPLFLSPSIFPSIRVFSNESVPCIRWPKYWSFRFSISLSNKYSGLILLELTGLTDRIHYV